MENKIVLVTGANTGIGKMTALALAKQGAHTVLLCRNASKAEAARQEIIKKSGHDRIEVLICDLSSQVSIREAASKFRERHDRLDVLVNNAGVFYPNFEKSPDGFEMQIAVNHLAYFLLTHLLLSPLKAAPNARIVNVSSGSHYKGKIDFDSFNAEPESGYSLFRAYSQSKLANVLFTRELARYLKDTSITTNSLHPGVVRTDIGMKYTSFLMRTVWFVMKPFMLTTKQGAQTSVFLASSAKVANVSGKYFEKMREKRSSELSYDDELAKELWERSLNCCGLKNFD
jgi:NAD(P)-dependent dehydrogenase (short-subunit alcohol dehydrogenase family)